MRKIYFCLDCRKELSGYRPKRCGSCAGKKYFETHTNPFRNKKHTLETRRKMRENHADFSGKNHPLFGKKLTEAHKQKLFKGRQLKPNKCEKLLNKLLQKLLPKQYKFVGNGYTFIAGFVPDFIDFKNKKIIEFYGDYWHSKERTGRTKKQEENRRINHFKKYGYKTLIIWEKELKDLEKITGKVLEFNNILIK